MNIRCNARITKLKSTDPKGNKEDPKKDAWISQKRGNKSDILGSLTLEHGLGWRGGDGRWEHEVSGWLSRKRDGVEE